MLRAEIIGNLGADAEIKEANGSKFVTMRVAHTDRWKDEDEKTHESTLWADVTMNNVESKVIPFLKAGTRVFIRGSIKLRVYSSPKDRCMKAGLTIVAQEIELLGGSTDEVPKQLVIPDTGALVPVHKYYQAEVDTKAWRKEDVGYLVDTKGNSYDLVKGGWVTPHREDSEPQGEQSEG